MWSDSRSTEKVALRPYQHISAAVSSRYPRLAKRLALPNQNITLDGTSLDSLPAQQMLCRLIIFLIGESTSRGLANDE